MDLVWIPRVNHGGTNKMSIKIVYIAHAHVSKFFEDDKVMWKPQWSGTHTKTYPHKRISIPHQ